MSKKVVWIWSLNANRTVSSVGYANSILFRPYKFQREMRAALAPKWEVEFISEDINDNEITAGDVTVVGQALSRYLKKEKYNNLVVVPEMDLMQFDYSAIKERLAAFL